MGISYDDSDVKSKLNWTPLFKKGNNIKKVSRYYSIIKKNLIHNVVSCIKTQKIYVDKNLKFY